MKLGSWHLEITDYQREPGVPRSATKAEVGSGLHTTSELHVVRDRIVQELHRTSGATLGIFF